MTGGRVFAVENLNELPDVATKISLELRNQYVLGYRPSNKAHDGRWRKIKIKMYAPRGLPPLSVYSKTGYYSPRIKDVVRIFPQISSQRYHEDFCL